MTIEDTARRVRRGQREVLRLQRRLWLAQLAFWPGVVLIGVVASAAAWAAWRRRSRAASPLPSYQPASD
ncbi:hypothetical protein [Mycobacterium parmense]|uniref:Uncharacterized protein n=1 Tax=Mycobacterium parmense TaxID=185642 RepID=A0A7I7YV43_9MYCO|nr:hypothetical protein [Mycobacterium parmense]MCV7351401.1 hypothetical protein [Mycobacterium parmense]ORW60914.1 hypothetical protein AWC20_08285 [Mycobacterium parmense]BBZ45142.1 hypothetical protein MPRM_24230 [Mycobacterium parmense]